jgi:tRNA(fMet)-specific endonuclease VapC
MYILDIDHLSLIQRNGLEGKRILTRLAAVEKAEVAQRPLQIGDTRRAGLAYQYKNRKIVQLTFYF